MNVEIRTERLILAPTGSRYLEAVHEYASDVENTRYMVFLPNETIDETAQFLREAEAEWKKDAPKYLEFAVLLDDAVIGSVGLYITDAPDQAELGWVLNKRFWGRGYIPEAVRAVMAWARESLGIRRFFAQCDSENTASWRVMEKLGMHRVSCEGGRRNRSADRDSLEYTYELNE